MREVNGDTTQPAPLVPTGIHLAAIYGVVTIGIPVAFVILAMLAFDQSPYFVVAVPALAIVLAGAFGATAALTGSGSLLGRSIPTRLALAVLVTVGGTLLFRFGWMVAEEADVVLGPANQVLAFLVGVPYVLVAATMVRVKAIAWTARIAVAIVFAGGIAVIWATGPTDAQARITHAQLDRNTLYTTTIPGYRATAFAVWEPQDPAMIPADRQISMQGMMMYAEYLCPPRQECQREQDDLTYWRESTSHGYVKRRGDTGVYITGGYGVDRALLREAVQTARLMTEEEVIQSLPPAPRWPGVANLIRSILPDNEPASV